MRFFLSIVLAVVAAAAQADTSGIRQTQLEFLDANASSGATANHEPVSPSDKAAVFKSLDIDGDGAVSKSEAAGNEPVTVAFDRADRNRDGKLSREEYDAIGKAPAKKKARQARNKSGSASAGGTKATKK